MPASAAARRYAQAVFDIGKDEGTLPQWAADLVTVRETLTVDAGLMPLLLTPETAVAEKQRLLDRLFDGRISPLSQNLVNLLLAKGRIALAPQVEEAFDELYLTEQGIAYADVTTAVPLSDTEEARVAASLSQLTGKTIRIRASVNPNVLGGIVARVGDQLIDGTVATQLRQLRTRLRAV